MGSMLEFWNSHFYHQSAFTAALLLQGMVILSMDFGNQCRAEADSCGPRASPRMMTSLPCDLSDNNYCAKPGAAYPWAKVRKFIHENQALMRRMYGDIRQVAVMRDEIGRSATGSARKLMQEERVDDEIYLTVFRDGDGQDSKSGNVPVTPIQFHEVEEIKGVDNSPENSTEERSLDRESTKEVTEATKIFPEDEILTTLFYKAEYRAPQQDLEDSRIPIESKFKDNSKLGQIKTSGNMKTTEESSTISVSETVTEDVTSTDSVTLSADSSDQVTVSEVVSSATATKTVPMTTTTTPTATTNPVPTTTTVSSDDRFEDHVEDAYAKVNNLPPITGRSACPVTEEIIAPYWANNTRGETLALMNIFPFEQYIHSELCMFEKKQMNCKDGCRCEQQFRWHRLLAFDPTNDCRGIFSDWFRFPAYCVCKCYHLTNFEFKSEPRTFAHRQGRRKVVKPIPLRRRKNEV